MTQLPEPAAQQPSDLVKRLREAQVSIAEGRIDLRQIGQILFGKFDQDLPAEMIARAIRIEALEAAAAQPSREAELVKALEEIAADEKIYKGHGNYDAGPLPGNISQEIARKALAAYDTPAKDERGAVEGLAAAVRDVERNHPLPRCAHGSPLIDGAGERLEPPCGCRNNG